MHLVAEGEAATFIVRTKPGIRVSLADRSFVLARATRCARHHRGIDQRALLDQKAAGIELPLQFGKQPLDQPDRKSTRLNSSHLGISYAVFCLKKKKKKKSIILF